MSLFKKIDCKGLFDQLPIASWIVDYKTLRILNSNISAVGLYGYSKEEFKKLHVWDLDLCSDRESARKRAKKLRKEKYLSFKIQHISKDEKILDVTISASVIKIDDEKFFNVTCQDNTNELNAENKSEYFEKKFEYFFNQLPDAILIIDDKFEKITHVNKAATELFGYSEDELKKIDISRFAFDECADNCQSTIMQVLEENLNSFEKKIQRKDGVSRDIFVSLKLLKSNKAKSLILTCHDITIQKFEQQQLKKLNESLQEKIDFKINELREKDHMMLEQAKLAQMGEMLNMIAHQWRQPLNSMSASAMNLSFQNELGIVEGSLIEDTTEFIQKEAQRMSQIINDFMEFNKAESNKEFYLYKAIEEVSNMVMAQLKNRAIVLEIDVEPTLKVFHNIKSIEHVLLNIIVNARDAFEEKKERQNKKIKISSRTDDSYIYIDIEDNAGGIPHEIINKIFNPYFTTKEQGKGTGIGLYMSKNMVESVSGTTLSVKNGNQGAIFSISFKKA